MRVGLHQRTQDRDAGSLDRRLGIYSITRAKDAANQPVESENLDATVWGSVEVLQGRELFEAQRIRPELWARLTIRYRPGIDSGLRIKDGADVWEIDHVVPVGREESLEIMAVKRG